MCAPTAFVVSLDKLKSSYIFSSTYIIVVECAYVKYSNRVSVNVVLFCTFVSIHPTIPEGGFIHR